MRIVIITLGSIGDVNPFVALGQGLRAVGHDVVLVTHTNFESFVRSRGLDFSPVHIDSRQVLEDEGGRSWLESGSNPVLLFRRLSHLAEILLRQVMVDCWNACQRLAAIDAIVSSPIAFCISFPIAEKLDVPAYLAAQYPLTATGAFANPFFPAAPSWMLFGRNYYNWMTSALSMQGFWQFIRPPMNKVLQEILHMQPLSAQWLRTQVRQQRLTVLYAYSPSFIPPPPDWGHWNHVTGAWMVECPVDWCPPDRLVDFLASGPPPVYVGFGSMTDRNPEEVTEIVLEALARSKQRAVLLTGWAGLSNGNVSDEVFKIDAIPHEWLFPQMRAVVHHGGAGTTAAGLRAGVPSIITPFFADQFFWGRRTFEAGVGPKPIPRRRLSAEGLAMAISLAATDEGIRKQAAALGERIRSENGVARAVEILHRSLGIIHELRRL